MAKKKNRVLKYKTLNKTSEVPLVGSKGNQPDTIYVKQVTDTTVKPYFTDNEGKAMELDIPTGQGNNEVPALKEVVNAGNYASSPISFLPEGGNTNKDTATQGDLYGSIGVDITTYTYHFGKFNPENKKGYYCIHVGYKTLEKNTGQSNVAIGHSALSKNTEGAFNTVLGNSSGMNMLDGSRNTFIGLNAAKNLPEGYALTMVGSNAGGTKLTQNRFPKQDLVDVSPVFEEYLTGKSKFWNKTMYGFKEEDGTVSSSTSVYLGASCGDNGPARAVGSIVIGSSPMDNIVYRNYNNIIIGNMIYSTIRNKQVHNSVLLGNHFNIHADYNNILAIHNDKTERVAPSNALIYGEFDKRKLKINGALTLNPANAPAVNNTFTKVAIANDNGDLTFLTLGQLKGLLEGVTVEPLSNS